MLCCTAGDGHGQWNVFMQLLRNQKSWTVKIQERNKHIRNLHWTDRHWLCPNCNYILWFTVKQSIHLKIITFPIRLATTNIGKPLGRKHFKFIFIKTSTSLGKLSHTTTVSFSDHPHVKRKDHCTLSPCPSMLCAIQRDVLSGGACWQSPRLLMFTHKHTSHQRSLFDVLPRD